MPTYDYACDACGHGFELFQSITEPVKRKCPECGKLRLRRLFGTGAAIVFKGSGFYQTDYRSESYKEKAKAEKDAANSSSSDDKSKKKESGASGNSDAKPDAKPSPPSQSKPRKRKSD
jgi:putative FmdB family regulatory protein